MQSLFVNEVCYLQFRYICELIAIGCLIAQGDYETQRGFRVEYSPPKIFTALKGLYPHFFPQPMTIISQPGAHHLEANNKPDAYGELHVTRLWQASGDHLHRASLTAYLKKTFAPPPDTASIDKHVNGLVRLLESHLIPVWQEPDHRRLLQVNLEDGDGNIEAHWMDFDDATGGMTISSFRSAIVSR